MAEIVEDLDAELTSIDSLVDDYEQTVADAKLVALDTLDNVEDDTAWAVPVIVALALAFALAQAAPIWLGLRLRSGADLIDTRP